tara:strand:+ start:811 stop:1356 length:546 start_codon:yes stop_codon:yes gene_type:complete
MIPTQTENTFQWNSLTEILIPLIIVAIVGYLISKLYHSFTIKKLNLELSSLKEELNSYQTIPTKKIKVNIQTSHINTQKTVYPKLEIDQKKSDDLKIIEGIGPKIEEILNKEGISTYGELANTSPIRLVSILRNAGPRFQIQDPTSWPKQANFAKFGKWIELQNLKNKLKGGKDEPPITTE